VQIFIYRYIFECSFLLTKIFFLILSNFFLCATTGGFGAAPAPSAGLFGAPPAPAPASGGLFGAAPAPSLFGTPAPAPATGGLFGAPAAAPAMYAQPQVATHYAAPPLGAVMPPAANEIMASQLAALDSKRKEMEQNDNFRNRPSESSSVTAISLSERESRRNMIGPATPARISSYRASPMSNAKLRPRGFASPQSDATLTNIPQSLSKLGTGGRPMAAPETVAASSSTRLIIAPSPRPKLKLTLGGGEKRTVKSAASTIARNINGGLGLGSVQNEPFMDSPQGVSTPKATPMNGSSNTTQNGGLNRAQQYYQQIIDSPDNAAGTPGSSKKQTGVPTLSKEGYACRPSIATLQAMDPADLAAVSNFSVMRKGVGKVAWEGAVDVRGANLDRIIAIDPKSVSIYTEEEEEGRKPEVGTKLNRSAILTLENVFPPDPSAPEKFVKKVTRQTMKMDAELISYDPSSGEWILRVQHFSRYALDDDSDDDEDIENKKPGTPELQENSHKGKVDFSLGEREGRSPVSRKDGMKKMSRQDTPYKMKGMFDVDEEDGNNDIMMNTNDVMIESSVMDEAETAFTQMQMSLEAENVVIAVKKKIEKYTALFPEESIPVAEDTSGNRRYIPDLQDLRAAASMPSFSSRLAKSKSISTSKSSSTDFGLRMGRSFRVGWSPDGSFFSVGKNGVLIRSKPKLEKIDVARELKLLETHRSYVNKTKVKEECPLLSLSSKTAGINPIKDTLESYSAAVKDKGGGVSSISDSAYSLLQVLHESKTIIFGTANKPADDIIDDQCLLSITRWFINSCREEVGNEIFQARAKQQKYKALLSAVSGGDLSTAAKIAEEENLLQLSILLASGPEGRKDVFREIMAWRKAGNTRSIPNELSRTYRLIAGDLGMEEDVYKQSSKGSTTFDWRRRMVMKLMFSKPEKACKSLSSAIAQYEADVSKGLAPFPSSHYCNNDVESTLFRLLRLGTQTQMSSTGLSLSNVVDPLGYTDDPNNFSLSFHLTSCITSIYASPSLSPEEEYTLLDGYAFQLQSLGLWEWAAYVFLCVLSDTTHATSMWRIERAKSLVLQNYFDDDNVNAKKRQFLEKLGLPSDWFEEASCYRSFTTGDTYGYIAHSLNLDPEKAAKVLERTLVPNILFINRERRDSILQLFEDLSSKMEHQSLVSAVSTFFAICEDIEDLERCSQAEIEESVPDLMETCEEIQQIFSSYKESEEKLANNGLGIVPENYLVPLGCFLAEALHQTSHFKLQLLALKEGMGMSNTASQMLKLLRSQGPSDYSIGNRENVCRWLM
jgi:nuclear pore complex protein Nup98-Nup96